MNCQECKEDRLQNEPVPYYIYEGATARLERASRRWMIAAIVCFVLFVGTNILWIHYENQFEDVKVEQDSGNGGYNNFIGNDGDIYNGEADNNLQETENGR